MTTELTNESTTTKRTMTPFQIATDYHGRGWSPIPVQYGSKNPNREGWQNLELTREQLSTCFNGKPQNIGVLLGEPSGGIVDADLDSREACTAAPFFFPVTNCVFGRRGKPRSHWIFLPDQEL